MMLEWLLGLFRTRLGRIGGSVAGIALTVALIAALGVFIRSSTATMTQRAIATVPIDWQIEMVPGSNPADIRTALFDAAPVARGEVVGYAKIDGLEFTTGGSVQSTGAGKIIGFGPGYLQAFPQGFRLLSGTTDGAVLLQQTAANLHAGPGDTVTIHRPGLPDATTKVTGVVDLTSADMVFQAIGVPPGAAPQAPPDNAMILPMAEWQTIFDPQANVRPDSVRRQLHVALDHSALPADPGDAYITVLSSGHNFEARVAGSAVLSNNLAARLDAARGDAVYARVLFLFLGAPGAVLAALLTIAIAASGSDRRRRDQSLLRLRGAPVATILRLAGLEAVATGVAGAVIGVVIAELASRVLLGGTMLTRASAAWLLLSAAIGVVLALAAILLPAWNSARTLSVAAARQSIGADPQPIWRRIYLDFILLALAGIVFWKTAASGYQVVLAPEGVPAISVDYSAFLAPVLLWAGAGLLVLRIGNVALKYGRKSLAKLLAGFAGPVSGAVAASLSRQRRRVAAGIALTALAFAFATSTAIFNASYQGQARVDAELTNGADVTVTGTTTAPVGPVLDKLKAIPGVTAIQGMQHRFAYVGNDLQDLYGVDPANIGTATTMSNAFFQNGDAKATLAALAKAPDGVLVSDETMKDFQLAIGDTLNLRMQGPDHQYHIVPFRFAGVVREFPTAPRDSFLIANASYVAKMTGVDATEVALLRTSGETASVKDAASVITKAMPGVRVTDLSDATHFIGSSLTSVDLGGLTRLELSFAILLLAGASGLVLALGLADRRRSFAILAALGAKSQALSSFIWSEALLILVAGAVFGAATGTGVAYILVKVLEGVFDPPPESLSVPWGYLALVLAGGSTAVLIAVVNALRETRISPVQRLREL
ncbi:MAG TPA: ABC transporter permease [Arsenicitalea sp.]|jgi:putative ABC transport system permease protein|nr:ABC transporter permease [Arsenicitalea sp.]